VGANTGDSTQALLDAGFTVFAFEPCPPVHQKLVQRFAEQETFTAFDVAIGATDGTSKLNLTKRTTSDSIEVRSLESLQRSRQIPAELGVVKIAAAGDDLDVIQGLGNLRPSVLVAEFRNEAHVPAKGEAFNSLPRVVREMRARGYKFNLSLYRLGGLEKSHFVSNTLRAPEGALGNVFFFAETSIFEKALNWCGVFL
jgi:FkbM family methyltransferase